jgi:hypothetical protein
MREESREKVEKIFKRTTEIADLIYFTDTWKKPEFGVISTTFIFYLIYSSYLYLS